MLSREKGEMAATSRSQRYTTTSQTTGGVWLRYTPQEPRVELALFGTLAEPVRIAYTLPGHEPGEG